MRRRKKADESHVSRRQFIVGAIAAGSAAVLTGCGGGSVFTGGGGVTRRPQTLTLNFDTAGVAVEDGRSVNYVASYTGDGLQSSYWGIQDGQGVVTEILQALVWDTNADEGVRVEFDGRGLPKRVVNEANGAFITVFWEAARSVFKFYQPSGAYIGGASVTGTGPNFVVEQLADSQTVGLFVGSLTGARDGIFSITIGGAEDEQQNQTGRKAPVHRGKGARSASRAPDPQLVAGLTKLSQITGTGDYPEAATALLDAMSTEYLSTGASQLWNRIVSTALNNTGLPGFFQDEHGLAILRGLLSTPVLQKAAGSLLGRYNGGEDLVQKNILRTEATSPGLTGFRATLTFPAPAADTDKTLLTGIMVAREFGSIPISGVIDSSGSFTATGSLNGIIVNMTGSVSGNTVSGTWTYAPSTRQGGGGGNFNGNQQPLGQCQSVQNSGGQGTFTNTYDLNTCGQFQFTYQAFSIPDHFRVLNGDRVIFDTGGLVSGGNTVNLNVSGQSSLVTVVVLASESGTAWNYTVGCPS